MKKKLMPSDNNRLSYTEIFADFIEEKNLNGLSAATLRGYKESFQNLYKFLSGDKITSEKYKSYIKHMKDRGLSINSVNHYIRCDRAFLYWCMKRGLIDKFEIKLLKGQETIKDVYTIDEIQRLTKSPAEKDSFLDWRTWAMTSFILATAAREGTVCNLQMKDISFEDRTIVLRHLKNKKVQILPMSDRLAEILKRYVRIWRYGCDAEDFLFPNVYGEKLTENALKHAQAKYNHSRSVEKTSVHLLRHTFVKSWCMAGGNVFKLQKVLGHSTLTMTQHYANLYSNDLKEDFEEFSALDLYSKSKNKKLKRYE